MKKQITIRLALFITCYLVAGTACSQAQYDVALKRQLDSILVKDQQFRGLIVGLPNMSKHVRDSLALSFSVATSRLENHLLILQSRLDKVNLEEVEAIIKRIGYPGKSVVGEPTNEAAWYIIQHSDKISQYFSLIKRAGKQKELPMYLVGTMEDRILMAQNKPQIYGTQASYAYDYDPTNDTTRAEWYIWPVSDAKNVNARRQKIGFSEAIEEHASNIGAIYRDYLTVERFLQMKIPTEHSDIVSFEKKERIKNANSTILPSTELSNSTFRYLKLVDSFSRLKDSSLASKYLLKTDPYYLIFLGQTPHTLPGYLSKFSIPTPVQRQYEKIFTEVFNRSKPPVYDTLKRFYDKWRHLRMQLDSATVFSLSLEKEMQKSDSVQFAYLYNYVTLYGWPATQEGALYAAYIAGRDIEHYYDYVLLAKKSFFDGQISIGMAQKILNNKKYYYNYISVKKYLTFSHEALDISDFSSLPGIGLLHSPEATSKAIYLIKNRCPIKDIVFVHYTGKACYETEHKCTQYCGHKFLSYATDACPSFRNEEFRVVLRHYDLPLEGKKSKEILYVIFEQ